MKSSVIILRNRLLVRTVDWALWLAILSGLIDSVIHYMTYYPTSRMSENKFEIYWDEFTLPMFFWVCAILTALGFFQLVQIIGWQMAGATP